MTFSKKFSVCVFVFFPFYACAWNATGHMMVSQIAYDHLTPAAKAAVDRLAKRMSDEDFYNTYTHRVTHYQDYLDIAHWPDDLKSQSDTFSSPWHFQNNAWTDDKSPIPASLATLPSNNNVVWAIGEAVNILSQPLQSVSGEDTMNLTVRARALSYLIHFVGDAHQPLHCSTRVSKDFPTGDTGGNDFVINPALKNYNNKLTFKYPIVELHALWDDALMLYPATFGLDPTVTAAKDDIRGHGRIAQVIEKEYPFNFFSPAELCLAQQNYKTLTAWAQDWANTWCQESFAIAKTIYPASSSISVKYLQKNTVVAQKRLALAGYRLGIILNTLFDPAYKLSC